MCGGGGGHSPEHRTGDNGNNETLIAFPSGGGRDEPRRFGSGVRRNLATVLFPEPFS